MSNFNYTLLPRLRKQRLMTQKDLSDATGISVNSISKMEKKGANPRASSIRKVAEALGVTPAYLSYSTGDNDLSTVHVTLPSGKEFNVTLGEAHIAKLQQMALEKGTDTSQAFIDASLFIEELETAPSNSLGELSERIAKLESRLEREEPEEEEDK